MTPSEKRARFRALAKHLPEVKTGRQFEQHHGQLELDFSPAKAKPSRPQKKQRPNK